MKHPWIPTLFVTASLLSFPARAETDPWKSIAQARQAETACARSEKPVECYAQVIHWWQSESALLHPTNAWHEIERIGLKILAIDSRHTETRELLKFIREEVPVALAKARAEEKRCLALKDNLKSAECLQELVDAWISARHDAPEPVYGTFITYDAFEEVLRLLRLCLKKDPTHLDVLSNLAWILSSYEERRIQAGLLTDYSGADIRLFTDFEKRFGPSFDLYDWEFRMLIRPLTDSARISRPQTRLRYYREFVRALALARKYWAKEAPSRPNEAAFVEKQLELGSRIQRKVAEQLKLRD